MFEYRLPSGLASCEMSTENGLFCQKEWNLPMSRKDTDKALMESLIILCRVKNMINDHENDYDLFSEGYNEAIEDINKILNESIY